MLTRTAFLLAVLAGFAMAAADVLYTPDPCGVPAGQQCTTDTECECMHPGVQP